MVVENQSKALINHSYIWLKSINLRLLNHQILIGYLAILIFGVGDNKIPLKESRINVKKAYR